MAKIKEVNPADHQETIESIRDKNRIINEKVIFEYDIKQLEKL